MKIIETKEQYDALLQENHSVFVDFYADWCGPCKMVAPIVEKVAAANTDVAFVKVNVDNNPEIASMYGIMSIPTLLSFKDGELAGSQVGACPEQLIQALVDAAK